jgi:hypothetical protein
VTDFFQWSGRSNFEKGYPQIVKTHCGSTDKYLLPKRIHLVYEIEASVVPRS